MHFWGKGWKMGQVAYRTQNRGMKETEKEDCWGNKDSDGPLYMLGKTKCNVQAQDGIHTQKRPEMSLGFTSSDSVGSTQVECEG